MKSRWLLWVVGGLATALAFFFGTLFFLDYGNDVRSPDATRIANAPDATRIANAKLVIAALKKYRAEKGAYPVLKVPDSRIKELTGSLVSGGYIASIPDDPPDAEPTHYVSYNGKAFGLWVQQKSGPCIVEFDESNTGWWGQPPACKLN
jgi:hypothetical protein